MEPVINPLGETPKITTRLIITLEGEAAARLLMWANGKNYHKNLAGRELLIEGMKDQGLLLKNYTYPIGRK